MIDRIRLFDVFPTWNQSAGGIFKIMQDNFTDLPWQDLSIATELDITYYGLKSGQKLVSPIVSNLLFEDVLTDNAKIQIAQTVHALYNKNWLKQYATLSLEYNPIENYSMTETENTSNESSRTETDTRTDNTTVNQNTTETNTPNLKQTNSVYGFNSENAVDSGIVTETGESINSGSYETKNTGTVSNDNESTHKGNSDRTLKRAGNIGVTTSQHMIVTEHDLWVWNFFNDVVFPDVDKILTLKIY